MSAAHRIEAIKERYGLDDDEAWAVLMAVDLHDHIDEALAEVQAAHDRGGRHELADLLSLLAPQSDTASPGAAMRTAVKTLAEPAVATAVLAETAPDRADSAARRQEPTAVPAGLGPAGIGALLYHLTGRLLKPFWGGPLNGQAGRVALCRQIFAALRPTAIVETGTYRGTSTEFFAEFGVPVHSVEADPWAHAFSAQRFRSSRDRVHLTLADSRTFLRQLAADPSFPSDGVFFYLDAHWHRDLPLAEEITIIFDNWRRSVVMIDDFEVPGDGYSYDDYGPGAVLNAAYLEAIGRTDLVGFYPSLPAAEETGARRGCIVLCNDRATGEALRALPSLRPAAGQPTFSIIVPTFNSAAVLRACLDSIAGHA